MTLDEAIKHCENVAAKCFVERSARNHSGKKVIEHLKQMPSVAPKQKTGK